MEGRPVKVTSTPQAIRLGIGYVPRNRKENGIIKDMDIVENGSMVTLPGWPAGASSTSAAGTRSLTVRWASCTSRWAKRPTSSPACPAATNRRWCWPNGCPPTPKVLILDNPTQGVDVGAKEEIYDIILRLAREGVAVVVLSSEAQEIIRVCDRALVLYHGALQGEVSGADMNEQTIMHLATGGAAPSAQAIHTEE